jgi:D-alanine-D-alanine ligase
MKCVNAMEGAAHSDRIRQDVLDITVLMGGPSSEKEVSILSGQAIAAALERRGHHVVRADISPADQAALERPGIDVVFVALHGQFGESGDVQRLCEGRGLRYTGSASRASELAMDKAATKQVARRIGLATPDWRVIEQFHTPQQVADWMDELGVPVVLKPLNGGSSIDLVIARSLQRRDGALDELVDKHGRCLVERYVRGKELTVGILADQALPVLQIIPPGECYDYRAKYADDSGTLYTFEHGLGADLVRRVQDDSLALHKALGCRDMSRVDFLLDEQGTAWLLEINTIPGFTSHSLLPMAAKQAGIGFDELVDRIARMAASR